jgi:hypothetical protein
LNGIATLPLPVETPKVGKNNLFGRFLSIKYRQANLDGILAE